MTPGASEPELTHLEAGDVVIDTEEESEDGVVGVESTKLLVRNVTGVTSDEYVIEGMTAPVSALNPGYSPSSTVIEVSYFGNIDGLIGEKWRNWLVDDFSAPIEKRLEATTEKWGVPMPKTYAFPADRLARLPESVVADYIREDDEGDVSE